MKESKADSPCTVSGSRDWPKIKDFILDLLACKLIEERTNFSYIGPKIFPSPAFLL